MLDEAKLFQGIAAVIFHLDGTLVDSNEALAQAWVEVFAERGHHLELFDVSRLIGLESGQLIQRAIGESAPEAVQTLEARHTEIVLSQHVGDIYPFDKANELIVLLKQKGLLVWLASSSNKAVREALLKRGGLEEQFPDQPDAKPSDRLLACLAGHEIEPQQCLVIGDTPYDGEAATQAGMRFLGLESGGWNGGSLPTAAYISTNIAALFRSLSQSS